VLDDSASDFVSGFFFCSHYLGFLRSNHLQQSRRGGRWRSWRASRWCARVLSIHAHKSGRDGASRDCTYEEGIYPMSNGTSQQRALAASNWAATVARGFTPAPVPTPPATAYVPYVLAGAVGVAVLAAIVYYKTE